MSSRRAASRALCRASSSRLPITPARTRPASSNAATSSSLPSSSTWQPALPAGASPAYDAALSYLSTHQTNTLSKLDDLRSKLDKTKPDPELLRRIDQLEIEAYANDPAVRRNFRETGGVGEMSKTIYRWLGEQKWRKEGGLDLLMQRLLQMKIVPDVLPALPPTFPLSLSANNSIIEPGSIQLPSTLSTPPVLKSQLYYHPSTPTESTPNPEALHTLLVLDPDAPSHETHSFQQRIHYLKTDIPLSVKSGEVNLTDPSVGKEILKWESPAPEQGTPNHRYVFLLFRQQAQRSSSSSSSSLSQSINAREDFDLRVYLQDNGLLVDDLIGVNMFRSKWSIEEEEYINDVHVKQRGAESGAPVYGKIPKEVKYGYPMSAKRQRKEEAREEAWQKAVAELEGLAENVQGLSRSAEAEGSEKVKL
ncbi:uncharacterized protein I303_107453 [Kwoniella dejecticola CBS 10117]|uniref:PEBP-like protein n=1 Tax=Kwoniella dejecticola CBS 10117 TaxID=1296121 RepID=A0A1A5ZZR3_9TREE|nr:uncharacterized protein I303_06857 [Kwoniella dejecticola CBS 10117]OBR83294.1 hypothetical protein I303_06857 [Kwoniella dejecticola CBS 10117]